MSSMKALLVTSEAHFSSTGGAATHTRGIEAIFADIASVKVLTLPVPMKHLPHPLKKLRAIILGLITGKPSKSFLFLNSLSIEYFKNEIGREFFDIAIINHSDILSLSEYIPDNTKAVLISHNIESDILSGEIKKLRAPAFLKQFLERDVRATALAEMRMARSLDLILPISRDDQTWYRTNTPEIQSLAIPAVFPGKPYDGNRPCLGKTLRLAWIGNLHWGPNREGVEWLLQVVLPQISDDGSFELHFYGAGTEKLSSSCSRVHGHGLVRKLETVWESNHIALCPILSGSGMNVKLAEALFNRIPVLGTLHSGRGLPPIRDDGLALIEPKEWASFLSSLV